MFLVHSLKEILCIIDQLFFWACSGEGSENDNEISTTIERIFSMCFSHGWKTNIDNYSSNSLYFMFCAKRKQKKKSMAETLSWGKLRLVRSLKTLRRGNFLSCQKAIALPTFMFSWTIFFGWGLLFYHTICISFFCELVSVSCSCSRKNFKLLSGAGIFWLFWSRTHIFDQWEYFMSFCSGHFHRQL